MKVKTVVIDRITKQPVGFVTAILVKAGDKTGTQLGSGFMSDENGVLEIDSTLLAGSENIDVEISGNGYVTERYSPDEFGDSILLTPKNGIVKKTKETLGLVPQWAWMAGGIVLATTLAITFIIKKVK